MLILRIGWRCRSAYEWAAHAPAGRRAGLTDATWKLLDEQFEDKQLLDVLITTGGYRMVSMVLNTFGVPAEPNSEAFP